MNVLLTLFEIQDYGGIVGDIEFLSRGLVENGHSVDLVILRNNSRPAYRRKPDGPKGSYPSYVADEVNTLSGWYGCQVMSYGTPARMKEWQDYANGYDLVIHEIPNPKPEGEWEKVYDIKPQQLIAAHDAHYQTMYPHIRSIAHKVKGISCTNHAGYHNLDKFPAPRAFIGAAHEVQDWSAMKRWEDRQPQAICAHVWKNWKNMGKVVAAAPMLPTVHMVMAGDGIEGRYMRSIDKCKPKYKGLWDAYTATDHEYRGLLTYEELFAVYRDSRVMVDLSASHKFAKHGNHFNRSVIEAYNNGVVPLCTDLNMHENDPQVVLFKNGETHREVSWNASPAEVAQAIESTAHMHPDDANQIIHNGREILTKYFDYTKVWEEYFNLAAGLPAGIYPLLETGE